jgi:hypothetical protein
METLLVFGKNGMRMGLESMKKATKMESLMGWLPVGMINLEVVRRTMKTVTKKGN